MIQVISDFFTEIRLKRKLKAGGSLTPLDVLKVASSPRLATKIATMRPTLTIDLPSNLVINGLENIVFGASVRIHSHNNMVISTGNHLHSNPAVFKKKHLVNSDEIDLYDEMVVEEYQQRGLNGGVVNANHDKNYAKQSALDDCGCNKPKRPKNASGRKTR